MNKTKRNLIYFIFGSMLIGHIILENHIGIGYIVYPISIYLFILLAAKKITSYEFLLLSLFVPQKYLQLLSVIIFLVFSGYLKKRKISKLELAFLACIALNSLSYCIYYHGLLFSTVFQIAVYYCIFGLIYEVSRKIDPKKTFEIFDEMFIVQILAVFIQCLYSRAIKDPLKGTLISAHYLGIYLIIYLYLQWKFETTKTNKFIKVLKILMCILLIVLSDAKHVAITFVFAILVYFIINKLKIHNKLTFCGVLLLIGMIAGVCFFESSIGASIVSGKTISVYIYNIQYNKKYTYLYRTLHQLFSINGILGFGVGQYGSQISLTMSKGLIHYWLPSEAVFKYAIQPFETAFTGLINEWYSTIGMPISSYVLGYPFVTLIAMIAELGIIGFLWFLCILDKKFKDCNTVLMFAFIVLGLFDVYLEIPCVFVMILIGTELLKIKGRLRIKKDLY